jgi:hypothetical protein
LLATPVDSLHFSSKEKKTFTKVTQKEALEHRRDPNWLVMGLPNQLNVNNSLLIEKDLIATIMDNKHVVKDDVIRILKAKNYQKYKI